MLSIIGRPWCDIDSSLDLVIHPGDEFDLIYEEDWLDNELSRQIITDIQGIDVTDVRFSVDEILARYKMPVEYLATGTKNLLLCKFLDDGRKFRMSMMGENCYKWLMDIAETKDICGVITTPLFFTEDDISGRTIYFPQNDGYANDTKSFYEQLNLLQLKRAWNY